MARRGRGPATHELDEAPERDDRPDALEQQEAPLLVDPREHGEDRRADEVQDQVELAVDRQPAACEAAKAARIRSEPAIWTSW